MPLSPIGDIGTATFSEDAEFTVTWETATDWDNYTAISATEHAPERDETRIRLGQENTHLSPLAFWRFYTGSGTTLDDVTANANDGTLSGSYTWTSAPSPRFAGALSSGGDLQVDLGSLWSTREPYYEFECWFKPADTSLSQKIIEQESMWTIFYNRNGRQEINFASFGSNSNLGPTLSTGAWHHVYARWHVGNEYFVYINGNQYSTADSDGLDPGAESNSCAMFKDPNGSEPFTGDIAEARAWSGSSPAVSSVSDTLYATSGSLTTATKSFGSGVAPNLQNLSYSLNGQSIDLDVIGSPGTGSEEIVTQTLAGASSYSLTWSNTHTDFRLRPKPSTGDGTVTPEFNRGELVA